MSNLAITALEMLEPYARSILAECETGGALFERKWTIALKQARAVVAALEAHRAAQHPRAGYGATARCEVCGTTKHHTGADGRVVPNPPRA